jgi:hypothetical protein
MLRNALVRVVSRETFSLETCSSTVPAQADAGDGDVPQARLIRSFRAVDFEFILRRRHHEGPDSLKPTPQTTKVVHTVIHRLFWLQHVICRATRVRRCHSTGTRAITVLGDGPTSTEPRRRTSVLDRTAETRGTWSHTAGTKRRPIPDSPRVQATCVDQPCPGVRSERGGDDRCVAATALNCPQSYPQTRGASMCIEEPSVLRAFCASVSRGTSHGRTR